MPRPYWVLWAAGLLLAFGTIFFVPAHYDDIVLVLKNPLVTGPWPGVKGFFLTPFAKGEYEPLNTLGHWLVFRAAGENVLLYRLTSLLLHAANACLAFKLFRRFLELEEAFCAAVLFSLYPAHVEVLALSSFKKHLGVAFFGFLLLDRRGGWPALALALLCKESALVLPVLVFLAEDRWRPGLFGVAALYVAARFAVVPRVLPALLGGSWPHHLLTSVKILFWYLGQLLWPSSLCLEHSLRPVTNILGLESLLLLMGLAALAAVTAALYRFDRVAWRGWAWCLSCLAPFLNVMPFLNYSLVANRYLYLASAGFFLFAVRLAGRIRPRPGLAVFLAAAALYGGRAAAHMATFADPWALWSQAARCAPDNPRARVGLGFVEMKRMLYADAAGEFERALAIDKTLLPVFELELGMAYAETGRLPEAARLALETASRRPSAGAWNNLGTFYQRAGRLSEAEAALKKAQALDPGSADIEHNLGTCHAALGRTAEAEAELRDAAKDASVRPFVLRSLGELYLKQGKTAQAQDYLEQALALNPMSWETASGLARLYGGAKGAAVLDVFMKRLEASLKTMKASPEPQNRGMQAYAERLHEQARAAREELLER